MFPGVPLRDAFLGKVCGKNSRMRRAAKNTRDVGVKQMLLSLAQQWRELAEKLRNNDD